MVSVQDLIAQKNALEKQIIEAQREQRDGAIGKIKELMAEHGLTAADLSVKTAAAPKAARAGGKVAAKYRNKATGEAWSGRGLQPKWLRAELAAGKSLTDFAV